MNNTGLKPWELSLIRSVFKAHPEVRRVWLFGSRALGTSRPNSDIDLAIEGDARPLDLAAVAEDLEELPLPYKFDVLSLAELQNEALRTHIAQWGKALYPENTLL